MVVPDESGDSRWLARRHWFMVPDIETLWIATMTADDCDHLQRGIVEVCMSKARSGSAKAHQHG